jgi:hypothetical protein
MRSWRKEPIARAAFSAAIIVIPAFVLFVILQSKLEKHPGQPRSEIESVAFDITFYLLIPGVALEFICFGHGFEFESWLIPMASWFVYFLLFYYGFHVWKKYSARKLAKPPPQIKLSS